MFKSLILRLHTETTGGAAQNVSNLLALRGSLPGKYY